MSILFQKWTYCLILEFLYTFGGRGELYVGCFDLEVFYCEYQNSLFVSKFFLC